MGHVVESMNHLNFLANSSPYIANISCKFGPKYITQLCSTYDLKV